MGIQYDAVTEQSFGCEPCLRVQINRTSMNVSITPSGLGAGDINVQTAHCEYNDAKV